MTEERQLTLFDANHQAKITKVAKGLQCDRSLTAFKNLSETIKIATGMLPDKFIPVLQQVCASYSTTTKAIKVGFADLCAMLSKFVIKSWRVIQRGMSKEDANALITLGNQINTDFKNELARFIELSRPDLVNIYSQLLLETAGDKIANLLKERDILEIDLLRRSEELTNKASECGINQGKIDSIEYEKQISSKAVQDSEAAKLELKTEISRLKGQINDYVNKVKAHRDYHYEERRRGIFSWKIREVHVDNGERIARENLNRLIDRIRVLEERLKNFSSSAYLVKQKEEATASLPIYEAKKIRLEQEYKELKKMYDQAEEKFYVVIQEIDRICRSAGTTNIKSIQAVDEVCRALQTGSEALISACDKIRTHLTAIDLDPNALVDAVLDALQLINMADEYNDTAKIKDIKRVLALE